MFAVAIPFNSSLTGDPTIHNTVDADHARALKQAGYAQLETIAKPWSESAKELLTHLESQGGPKTS